MNATREPSTVDIERIECALSNGVIENPSDDELDHLSALLSEARKQVQLIRLERERLAREELEAEKWQAKVFRAYHNTFNQRVRK
jgi:hypothetical protein